MNKATKIIGLTIMTILLCYFSYFIIISNKYSYRIDMKNYKQYLWIFKDSALNYIDTNIFVGCIRERDVLFNYIYKDDYYIAIWEFKDVSKDLENIFIYKNIDLSNLKFNSSQVLNRDGSPEFTVRFVPFFQKKMDVNIDQYSEIKQEFKSMNYKGFYGTINKVTLSNEDKQHLVLIEFPYKKENSLFLLYKKAQSFFVIIIHSEKFFDKSIINILNLK